MKLLKTLDRALAISATIVASPAIVLAHTAAADLEAVAEVKTDKGDARMIASLVRVSAKTLTVSVAASIKYGYLGAINEPESRRVAARMAAEVFATIQELSETEKTALITDVVQAVDAQV